MTELDDRYAIEYQRRESAHLGARVDRERRMREIESLRLVQDETSDDIARFLTAMKYAGNPGVVGSGWFKAGFWLLVRPQTTDAEGQGRNASGVGVDEKGRLIWLHDYYTKPYYQVTGEPPSPWTPERAVIVNALASVLANNSVQPSTSEL